MSFLEPRKERGIGYVCIHFYLSDPRKVLNWWLEGMYPEMYLLSSLLCSLFELNMALLLHPLTLCIACHISLQFTNICLLEMQAACTYDLMDWWAFCRTIYVQFKDYCLDTCRVIVESIIMLCDYRNFILMVSKPSGKN